MTVIAPRREYSNPPIAEVICQVTFAEPVPWSAASPGLLYGEIRGNYPAEPKSQTAIEASIDGATSGFQVGRGIQRFVYSNDKQNRRLVANEQSLSVNALPPYEQWDSLANRFESALEMYETAIAKFTPRAVSLRYINKIVVPDGMVDLAEYFTVPIVLTHREGAMLQGFVSRSSSLSSDDSITTTVTFGSAVGHEVEGESAFILDIELEVPAPSDADFDGLGKLVAQLHRWENHEFESSITEKCRELFQ